MVEQARLNSITFERDNLDDFFVITFPFIIIIIINIIITIIIIIVMIIIVIILIKTKLLDGLLESSLNIKSPPVMTLGVQDLAKDSGCTQ